MNRLEVVAKIDKYLAELNTAMKLGPSEDWITRVEVTEVVDVLETLREDVRTVTIEKEKLYIWCARCGKKTAGNILEHYEQQHPDKLTELED